jgi:prepilin-type N-terminal cleavage/methylation domain-containing protein
MVKQTYIKILSREGFNLVELLIAMALFMVIMTIASQAFNSIIAQSSKYSKMEESNIEGIVGLEIMRHDIDQMGFGLPWGWSKRDFVYGTKDLIDSTITYEESSDTAAGADLNDYSRADNVPRAFVGIGKGLSTSYKGDYLAIKGTTVGRDVASQRWTTVPFHNFSTLSNGLVSQPLTLGNPPKTSESVLAINMNFNDTAKNHKLLIDHTRDDFFFTNFSMGGIVDDYLPVTDQDTVMLYGVSGTATPRMPFNRSDYFISTSSGTVPSFCAENTGVLYKATVNHVGGGYNPIPILDCVADMRIVLGWDTDGSGSIRYYSGLPSTVDGNPVDFALATPPAPTVAITAANFGNYLKSPKEIRERLKIIKVYILVQEGKRDPSYLTPESSIIVGDIKNFSATHNTYTFTDKQRQYRWKLYQIVTRPKNLYSNQK